MKLKWDKWFYNGLKSVIGGVAATGGAYIGTLVGNQITADIPVMNWKSLGFVVLFSSLSNLFFYLQKSPVPDESTGNTEVLPKPPTSNLGFWLLCALLSFGLVGSFTGCGSTPVTREAKIYYSFKDTWTVAHTAYQGFCERVVQGKVSKESEAKVDADWNRFRAAFKIALRAANQDWTQPSDAELNRLRDELLTLIRTAL